MKAMMRASSRRSGRGGGGDPASRCRPRISRARARTDSCCVSSQPPWGSFILVGSRRRSSRSSAGSPVSWTSAARSGGSSASASASRIVRASATMGSTGVLRLIRIRPGDALPAARARGREEGGVVAAHDHADATMPMRPCRCDHADMRPSQREVAAEPARSPRGVGEPARGTSMKKKALASCCRRGPSRALSSLGGSTTSCRPCRPCRPCRACRRHRRRPWAPASRRSWPRS